MEGSRLQWKSNMGPIGQIINHFDTRDQDWQNKKGCDGHRGVSPITMSRCGSTWNLSKHQLIKTITVKNAPRQPAVRHFLYNPPNIIQLLPNKFYNLTMVFYQDLLNGQFHSDFASQQPGHWGGSLSRSDLVVDLAELLLILWIVLVDTEESPLYSSSPPIASEMTHFQRVKRFLCVKILKAFLLSDTTHSELEIQFE